jgi:hypothetical protein
MNDYRADVSWLATVDCVRFGFENSWPIIVDEHDRPHDVREGNSLRNVFRGKRIHLGSF